MCRLLCTTSISVSDDPSQYQLSSRMDTRVWRICFGGSLVGAGERWPSSLQQQLRMCWCGTGSRRWRFLSASVTIYVRQGRLRNSAMFQVQRRLGITVCCVHEMTQQFTNLRHATFNMLLCLYRAVFNGWPTYHRRIGGQSNSLLTGNIAWVLLLNCATAIIIIIITRKCTLWRCKSTPTPKAKLVWMTSHYGPTVVRSVTEIPFHVFIW